MNSRINLKVAMLTMCGVILIAGGIATTKIFANNSSDFEPAVHLNQEELTERLHNVGTINNHFGAFEKSNVDISGFSSSQVVYNEEDVNEKTKVIVLSYGTFIKS